MFPLMCCRVRLLASPAIQGPQYAFGGAGRPGAPAAMGLAFSKFKCRTGEKMT